jgi:hypothetical protein
LSYRDDKTSLNYSEKSFSRELFFSLKVKSFISYLANHLPLPSSEREEYETYKFSGKRFPTNQTEDQTVKTKWVLAKNVK